MKKTILTIAILISTVAGALAQTPVETVAETPEAQPAQKQFLQNIKIGGQPESVGLRIGAMGVDVSYNHSINSTEFIQADLGIDFGYNVSGTPGLKATALYNWIWARPAWTDTGRWAIYAGAGLSLGYVEDAVPYSIADKLITGIYDSGFMIAATAQVGISYTFDFPLQLAIDIRPYIGIHCNDGKVRMGDVEYDYGGKTGFYDNGLMGFIPTISARYMF